MSTKALIKYKYLNCMMITCEIHGHISELDRYDILADKADSVWWDMTLEDREEFGVFANEYLQQK